MYRKIMLFAGLLAAALLLSRCATYEGEYGYPYYYDDVYGYYWGGNFDHIGSDGFHHGDGRFGHGGEGFHGEEGLHGGEFHGGGFRSGGFSGSGFHGGGFGGGSHGGGGFGGGGRR